ncbi:MAG: FAD-binding oxidoreductase [Chitinophagaceae bacterium]|nr:FAD-binding oxidoreductase [Chitinophagaceae bacterium]
MKTDYLVVGQGICGTFLSWYLEQGKQDFLVIDNALPSTPSKVASGVINPITGRILATTWLAETLLPFTWNAYEQLGITIGADIIKEYEIISFPSTQQMKEAHEKRIGEYNSYIQPALNNYPSFNYLYNSYSISPVWLVDLHPILNNWRNFLQSANKLTETFFDVNELKIEPDCIQYKDITAKKIIFCNGTEAFSYSFWKNLPYADNKGEALIADVPELSRDHIYKIGSLVMVPWYNNQWWIGSSYEREFESAAPTDAFRKYAENQVAGCLRVPFKITGHLAGIRPANMERRPFVGLHPHYPSVGILNGMGTKGCSLAPYFANQFVKYLVKAEPIDPLADVGRFSKVLKRET